MGISIEEIARENGFKLERTSELPEIDGDAFVMTHVKSKAKLLYLRNDDSNKAFSITFKTPASDNTGVFHILEHSVLCGSRKFPVKEPFVNLLKSSMQTFLNAMTFPDKTMYPVASTNEQDLMNLMDVYMDAVFYPNIYSNEQIFMQEGWHLELDQDEDTPHARPRVVYNGVVFNEMKGALSSPESMLYDTLSAALFPDNTYRFESGGIPAEITKLTYEDFLTQHKVHYRTDNSYIVLYGDLDIAKFLKFLSEKYLNDLALKLEDSDRCKLDEKLLMPQKPVVNMDAVFEMGTAQTNSCCALGYVAGTSKDVERMFALDILFDAIGGSNEAPLKRAILDAGIADDCSIALDDSQLQPFAVVQIKGLKEDAADKLVEVVEKKVCELASGGLDEELVNAALSHAEFVMREHEFGYPDGVIYSMSAMNGWLYDDNNAIAYIKYEEIYAKLHSKLGTSYYRDLLREVFLENNHHARAVVIPVDVPADDKVQELEDALSQDLDDVQLEKIAESAAALKEAQLTPDSPEDLAKLPRLSIADIEEPPQEPGFGMVFEGEYPVIKHSVETHGISYAYRYFTLADIPYDELSWCTVLATVLGRLDTAHHSAAEIDTWVQSKLGNLSFAIEAYDFPLATHPFGYSVRFTQSTSALSINVEEMARISEEVLLETDFSDTARIKDMLTQRRVSMERYFTNNGNGVASARALSYMKKSCKVREQIGGVDFYLFLKNLLDNFDAIEDEVPKKLESLVRRIFHDGAFLLSFAGGDAELDKYLQASKMHPCIPSSQVEPVCADEHDEAGTTGTSVHVHGSDVSYDGAIRYKASPCGIEGVPEPVDLHEAFIVPTDVTFTSCATDMISANSEYSGIWSLASKVLTYDYLWNEVRVVGGAYGVGFKATRAGSLYFASFRDPRIDETIKRFQDAGLWLLNTEQDADEFTGYVVSTVASMDTPLKARMLIKRQDSMILIGISTEDRLKARTQVIKATAEDLKKIGQALLEASSSMKMCTVGSKDIIAQSDNGFTVMELFGENA